MHSGGLWLAKRGASPLSFSSNHLIAFKARTPLLTCRTQLHPYLLSVSSIPALKSFPLALGARSSCQSDSLVSCAGVVAGRARGEQYNLQLARCSVVLWLSGLQCSTAGEAGVSWTRDARFGLVSVADQVVAAGASGSQLLAGLL